MIENGKKDLLYDKGKSHFKIYLKAQDLESIIKSFSYFSSQFLTRLKEMIGTTENLLYPRHVGTECNYNKAYKIYRRA